MLRSFLHKTHAVAFVETAILAPVLVLILLNSFDLTLLNNYRSVVENSSSNLSKLFGYISLRNKELLSELALSSFGNGATTSWEQSSNSAKLQEYIGNNLSFENYLKNLLLPLSYCGSSYCADGVNIHLTVYECDVPNNVYFEKSGFLSGGFSTDSSYIAEVNDIIASTEPASDCASFVSRKYVRLISFLDFSSPFSNIFEFQLNHVTLSVIENSTPINF